MAREPPHLHCLSHFFLLSPSQLFFFRLSVLFHDEILIRLINDYFAYVSFSFFFTGYSCGQLTTGGYFFTGYACGQLTTGGQFLFN